MESPSEQSGPSFWRLLTASAAGTVVETYDLILTALVASLVFNHAFFPDIAPWIGTLAAIGAAAVAYVGRPLGAVVFGWIGDRYGRLPALRVSILGAGLATVGIGLIPTAETIGVMAPIILVALRLVQGIALGGEFGGATSIALEHAPPHRRFLYGTFASVGSMGGVALATVTVLATTAGMGMDAFREWGWRIPFVASAILIVVALIARRLEESPEFEQERHRRETEAGTGRPVEALSVLKRGLLVLACLVMTIPSGTITFALSTGMLPVVNAGGLQGIDIATFQVALVVLSLLAMPISLWGGWLGGRVRPELVIIIGGVLVTATAFPVVALIGTGSPVLLFVAIVLAAPGYALVSGPAASFVAASLPTGLRYLGIGIAYAGASLIGGGVLPVIALAIAGENYDTLLPFACILAGAGVVALMGLVLTGRARSAVGEAKSADSAPVDDVTMGRS